AASYQRTFCEGQKYGPLKISCKQRICTPFLPASSSMGRCFSNIADGISATGFDSSLTGFEAWINPHFTVRAILRLQQCDRVPVRIGEIRATIARTLHRNAGVAQVHATLGEPL